MLCPLSYQDLARTEGLEPPTSGFGIRRSTLELHPLYEYTPAGWYVSREADWQG